MQTYAVTHDQLRRKKDNFSYDWHVKRPAAQFRLINSIKNKKYEMLVSLSTIHISTLTDRAVTKSINYEFRIQTVKNTSFSHFSCTHINIWNSFHSIEL